MTPVTDSRPDVRTRNGRDDLRQLIEQGKGIDSWVLYGALDQIDRLEIELKRAVAVWKNEAFRCAGECKAKDEFIAHLQELNSQADVQ